MAETHPPTRITEKEEHPEKKRRDGRVRDARAAEVGLGSRETEKRGEGVGYAEEARSPDTEHKTTRDDRDTA